MSQLTERFTHLNKRTRIVLAVGAALALTAVAGGALLALDPPLAARGARALPGTTVKGWRHGQ